MSELRKQIEKKKCVRCGELFEASSFLSDMCMDCALEMSE